MMMTKNDDGLRARMATLTKQKINELRAAYTRTTGKPANRLGRDALIKTLAASGADAAPTAKTPTAAKPPRVAKGSERDPRLPAPGGSIKRTYKGREYTLEVLDQGFRVGPKEYRSSSAAALGVTGYQGTLSGPAFWGYAKPAAPTTTGEAPAKAPRAARTKRAPRAKK